VVKYPGRVYFRSRFDDQLAHQIYAGSDIFLMPSRFEPCGIGQLISFKYGTVPVVYKTGGLADTVVDMDADRKNASGFVFTRYESEAMGTAVRRAIKAYGDQGRWAQIVDRIMRLNFSWKESARQYQMLYERMLRRGA
jgi:starch synthase